MKASMMTYIYGDITKKVAEPISSQFSVSILSEHVRKPLIFSSFKGVLKCSVGFNKKLFNKK